jgi:hypothetical protein
MYVVDWWDCFKDDWNEVYNTLVYHVVGKLSESFHLDYYLHKLRVTI